MKYTELLIINNNDYNNDNINNYDKNNNNYQ